MIEYGTSKRMPAPDDPQTSILVLVTNQFQCERLIRTGRKIANLTGTPVYVINVQHRGDKYEANPEALQHLFDVSKHNDAEMKVYFAADPFEQICEIIETYKARHVITGIPVGEDSLVHKLWRAYPDINFYTVTTEGEEIQVDTTSQGLPLPR